MKKIIVAILILNLIGCSSDDESVTNNQDYLFLGQTRPQFRGQMENAYVFWEFNLGTYQTSSSFYNMGGDPENPERLLRFSLLQENGNNQFIITAPVYNTSSETEFNEVFGLGLKKIGDTNQDFRISFQINDEYYELCDPNANYDIEILKTEVVAGSNAQPDYLKVWFKIDNINLNNCGSNTNNYLNNGQVVAQFVGYKTE